METSLPTHLFPGPLIFRHIVTESFKFPGKSLPYDLLGRTIVIFCNGCVGRSDAVLELRKALRLKGYRKKVADVLHAVVQAFKADEVINTFLSVDEILVLIGGILVSRWT
jgi:hypothetical protein